MIVRIIGASIASSHDPLPSAINSRSMRTPAESLPRSETDGLGKLDMVGEVFCNLPPLYISYIHRSDLEAEISRVLSENDRYPIITLKGGGGIGKTSLALSVLHSLAKSDRFGLILWFSSRDIDLMAEGIKPVKNRILDENDIANEYAELLELNPKMAAEDRVHYLMNDLTKNDFGPTLFVFDNFETVRNPSELFQWLDTYIRLPNKILITSRTTSSFKADYPVEVSGMREVECRELISRTAADLEISSQITESVIENLIQESSGHPYVIKMFVSELAKDNKVSNITRVVAAKEEVLGALFRRTFDWLSPSAKRVFLTLCSWRSVVPQIALEATLLRAENERIDVAEAIEELRKSSFIEVTTSSENEVFLSVPLAASLFGKHELEVSSDKVAVLLDRDLLQEFGAARETDIVHGVGPRILRKFREIANQVNLGKTQIEDHRPTLEYIARKYPYGWRHLSSIYLENNDLARAQDSLREYLKSNPPESDKMEVWKELANLYQKGEQWFEEVNALVELVALPSTTLLEVSEAANAINKYFQHGKLNIDSEIKEKLLLKVTEIMEEKMADASATDYSRLAWLFLNLKKESDAIRMTLKGLKKDRDNEYCNRLAVSLNITFS